MSDAMDVVRRLFRAVERRDRDAVMACYAEDVEIHEAAVLPYGGTWRGRVLWPMLKVSARRGTPIRARMKSDSIRISGVMLPTPCASSSATAPSTRDAELDSTHRRLAFTRSGTGRWCARRCSTRTPPRSPGS